MRALLKFTGFITVDQSLSALWGKTLGRMDCRGRRWIVVLARAVLGQDWADLACTSLSHTTHIMKHRELSHLTLTLRSVYVEMRKISCLIFNTGKLLNHSLDSHQTFYLPSLFVLFVFLFYFFATTLCLLPSKIQH